MPDRNIVLKVSVNFTIAFILVFCFCQSITAQSGRRPNRHTAAPAPTPVPTDSTLKTDSSASSDLSETKPDEKITSILVVGTDYNKSWGYYSTDLKNSLKELTKDLKERIRQPGLVVARGEAMKFDEAIERAKKESDTYILWIELKAEYSVLGYCSRVDYIDYAVLAPQTAKRLTYGRVDPGKKTVIGMGGGILRLPTTGRRDARSELRWGMEEIANRLIRWGWIS